MWYFFYNEVIKAVKWDMHNEKTEDRYQDMLTTAFGKDIVKFMNDSNIIEIMVNPDGKLWLDFLVRGKVFSGIVLPAEQVENIIKLVAATKQIIANEDYPEVACELFKSGARFQGWLPPVVISPTFTVSKRAIKIFSIEDYIKSGSITVDQANFLKKAIIERKNVIISGGAGSGKTTLANALLYELRASKDRIIVLEDIPELQIAAADYVKLATTDKKNMHDLVKGVLRMRPDRIIIGEVRDGSALELLKAWNTGHPGGLCTIHANSPEATITRLEDLIREVIAVVPINLIAEAVNIIVFMYRDSNFRYIVDSVTVCEKTETGRIKLHNLQGFDKYNAPQKLDH
jgi:type IV secretion system protein TrbB